MQVMKSLRRLPGMGPTGASIFCCEVQVVWDDLESFIDGKVVQGAGRLGLPRTPGRLVRLE
ncbi:MAG: hypothetical protein ACRD0P_00220 [Stackebrandtia sp.]